MKINKKGFTLIELLISITIFMILVVMSFVPYQYYSNISKVKIAAKDISQSIAEVRNLAINGFDKNGINQSVVLMFDKNDNNLKYYTFDYSSGTTSLAIDTNHLLKKKALPDGVVINDISGREKVSLYFSSIYGSGSAFDQSMNVINDDILEINISYKMSRDPNLNRRITFYKKTNLTDY